MPIKDLLQVLKFLKVQRIFPKKMLEELYKMMYKLHKEKDRFNFYSDKFKIDHNIHTIPKEYLRYQRENDGPVLTFEMQVEQKIADKIRNFPTILNELLGPFMSYSITQFNNTKDYKYK